MKLKQIFLLGGNDLEMQTIVKILDQNNYMYFDNKLAWNNAKLSSYVDILSKYGQNNEYQIYGIELQEDIEVPSNYIELNHHNKLIDRPSALEQVLEIIQIPLTRYFKLVAANDKGYIPALIEIGATEKEIKQIRLADRQAQGVSKKDENSAIESIKNQAENYPELVIVKALSSSFSPICDNLYPYERLLIYTDNSFTFYGKQAQQLRESVENKFTYLSNKLYYGGGENGYWGIPQDTILKENIIPKENIIQVINHIKIDLGYA